MQLANAINYSRGSQIEIEIHFSPELYSKHNLNKLIKSCHGQKPISDVFTYSLFL